MSKVVIGYPPIASEKGVALLSQNRQFQWNKGKTVIYPVVMAEAATRLKQAGHEAVWLDGIAEGWSYEEWEKKLLKEKPDWLVMETKTPVIRNHWEIINRIKNYESTPKDGQVRIKIVLVGDHVSALPEESKKNCGVDYVVKGGDYDIKLLELINSKVHAKGRAGKTQKLKSQLKTKNCQNLDSRLRIDRELTRWELYAYKNGNFKYFPGAYIMAGRDCWWRKNGGCTFCAWTILYPNFRVREVEDVLDEIGGLIEKCGVKEIFDDTGTFPVDNWLKEFCEGVIERGYQKKVKFGCNMRFGVLKEKDYELMARAGFRLILYGLESANQATLDQLNKGIRVDKVEKELEIVKSVGLEPHVACMVGYPWETKKEAEKTIDFCKKLFSNNLIDSLQGTVIIPYPGTKLFAEAEKKGWLKTRNWDDYDMSRPVLKTEMSDKEVMNLVKGLYWSAVTPRFLMRRVLEIRKIEDVKYLWRETVKVLGF